MSAERSSLFSSRRRHTRYWRDWSSDVCSSDLLVGGTPGGDGQPQWSLQLITNMIDYGMDPQEAIEAPRWISFPGTDPVNASYPFELRIEERVGTGVIRDLATRGHRVKPLGPWSGGGTAQLIARDPDGILRG